MIKDSEKTPQFPNRIKGVLDSMGLSEECRPLPDNNSAGWGRYRFTRADGNDTPIPVLLFEHKAKAIPDAKRQVSGIFHCIVLLCLKSNYSLYFKSASSSLVFALDGTDACEQAVTALSSAGFASAGTSLKMRRPSRILYRTYPPLP